MTRILDKKLESIKVSCKQHITPKL